MAIDSEIKRKRALSFWRFILPPIPSDGTMDNSDRALTWGQYWVFETSTGEVVTGDSYMYTSISATAKMSTSISDDSYMYTSIFGKSYLTD